MEKINTDYKQLEKLRPNFSRCANLEGAHLGEKEKMSLTATYHHHHWPRQLTDRERWRKAEKGRNRKINISQRRFIITQL